MMGSNGGADGVAIPFLQIDGAVALQNLREVCVQKFDFGRVEKAFDEEHPIPLELVQLFRCPFHACHPVVNDSP